MTLRNDGSCALRAVVARILSGRGYVVLQAGGGAEALALAEHAGPIQLLVTDVVMPSMSGPELSRRLCELRPELRVLFITGSTEDDLVHRGIDRRESALLEKPLRPVQLLARVREVLDAVLDA